MAAAHPASQNDTGAQGDAMAKSRRCSRQSGVSAADDAPFGAVVPHQHFRGAATIGLVANGGFGGIVHHADHAQGGRSRQVGKGNSLVDVKLTLGGLEGIESSHRNTMRGSAPA